MGIVNMNGVDSSNKYRYPDMRMNEMRPRLLQDFIVPHLEQKTFRDKLHWVDRPQKTFRIFWRHQSSSKFGPEDSCVFEHWARVKGLWDPKDERGKSKAKQRLRAALLKLKSVKCVYRDSECRIYKILSSIDSRGKDPSIHSGDVDEDSTDNSDEGFEDFQPERYNPVINGDIEYNRIIADIQPGQYNPMISDDIEYNRIMEDIQPGQFDPMISDELEYDRIIEHILRSPFQTNGCFKRTL